MTKAIPILDLRRKYLPIPTLEQSAERLKRAALRCALNKAWTEEFALEIVRNRRRK